MAEDRYQIDDQVGRGAFGAVYRARHKVLDTECALKLIPGRGDHDQLLEEAKKLASLPEHENVVRVLDAGVWDDSTVFIASELCLGGSLADVAENQPMDPGEACAVLSEACRGLEHLHQHDLLHLDIRPANILLGEGHPRLVDFGLSRWMHEADVSQWYGPHAAPELVEFGLATVATDVYAMAMTLAHVLTGGEICRPFPTNWDLVQASADGDWPRITELGVNVPKRIRNLIAKSTEYDPSKRPQSVAEFKRRLDKATPATSLTVVDDECLAASDGSWSIDSVALRDGRFRVDVRANGRRRMALGIDGVSRTEAQKHVQKVVQQLALGDL